MIFTLKWLQRFKGYQRQLSRNEALDFDDLIMTTINLFERVPETLEYYQNKFQYIHVDEYQDTNKAQYTLVKLLANKFKIYVLLILTNLFMVGEELIYKIFYLLKRTILRQRQFSRTELSFN